MYDELIKVLRETDFSDGCPCGAEPMCKDRDCVILQAADAIEELSAHYCPHAIRNVHDRGDDSLCRVLMREVPKGE